MEGWLIVNQSLIMVIISSNNNCIALVILFWVINSNIEIKGKIICLISCIRKGGDQIFGKLDLIFSLVLF